MPIDNSTQTKLEPLAIPCRHASRFGYVIAHSSHATSNRSPSAIQVYGSGVVCPSSLHACSKIIVSKNTLVEALVRHGPRPSATSFATEQTFWARRLLEHAVFVHGLHLVAGGVSEEVLEVFVFEGEGVAGDSCLGVSKKTWIRSRSKKTYRGRDWALWRGDHAL